MKSKSSAVSSGIGFGSALAMVISWSLHKSISRKGCYLNINIKKVV